LRSIADRVREILQRPGTAPAAGGSLPPGPAAPADAAGRAAPTPQPAQPTGAARRTALGASSVRCRLEDVLGGEWRAQPGGAYFVVESRMDPSSMHGAQAIGAIADRLNESIAQAPVLAGRSARAPLVFLDLETTGLSGGAGTYAFLVGCAWFDASGAFVARQFVVVHAAGERALLAAVADALSAAGALVSFNGRSFDAPMLETRYLYHRLGWPAESLPHLDMLHVARRLWRPADRGRCRAGSDGGRRGRSCGAGTTASHDASCSLAALERQVLGYARLDDVDGVEIPGRYFQFVRTGDPRPLAAIVEHNRRDLLSLAALTGRALDLVRLGPSAARTAMEALALGRLYVRASLEHRAIASFERAIELAGAAAAGSRGPVGTLPSPEALPTASWVHVDALRELARLARRGRRHVDAAGYWERILALEGCSEEAVREASEALAVHHEHRARDLETARAFALQALGAAARSRTVDQVAYRLKRLERKMGAAATARRPPFLPLPPASGSPTSGRRTSS